MYSLYRAWLSLGPCSGLGPLPTALPSPTPLNLSTPTQLPGVPDVALQVGPGMTQFSAHKAVISAHSGYFKAALVNHTGISPIVVPNVNVDEFSSLLTFMYTGYLDLNIANIYNILLATHILHMPRALEICRSFLLQTQSTSTEPNRTNIIKPIASRKTAPATQQFYPPVFSSLRKSEDTPFKIVGGAEKLDIHKASTSKTEDYHPPMEVEAATTVEKSLPTASTTNIVERKLSHHQDKGNKQKKRPTEVGTTGEKVIIDIACCDGPVRFHRVINKNYGMQPVENYEIQQHQINRNAVLNKVMTANIRDKLGDENQIQNNELFTCLYCNHTFKSQYCYQKHARRHLNPVTLETKTPAKETKREVKLLDMNVQYYPCKTCGSKFPSYYFVHKHRKLCHAEEMADNNNKNNEMVPENMSAVVEHSNSSAIDVEAVNTDTS